MENLWISLGVVFPIFFIMSLGHLVRRMGLVDVETLSKMNRLVFRIFMSSLIFLNIYRLPASEVFQRERLAFVSYPMLCILGMLILAFFFYRRRIPDRKQLSVMIQASYRGNVALFGIPIVSNLYGEEALGLTSLLLVVVIPIFNMSAIVLLEYYRGAEVSLKKLFLSSIKNPLMIASFSALFCLFFDIKLPGLLLDSLGRLSQVAIPLSFIILGGTLDFSSLRSHKKYLCWITITKLILLPAVTVLLAHFLGFAKMEVLAFLAATACPAAVSSFTMAKEMDADADLAGEIVVSTSVTAIFTVFLWIFLLKTLAWI